MTYLMVLMQCLCFFLNFFLKACVVGTHLNCIGIDAIQMGTHNLCLYKEVDKKYTGCNLKTTELLDCVLIGVIRSNTVYYTAVFSIINPNSNRLCSKLFYYIAVNID